MKKIAFYVKKGGTGKTTMTGNVGFAISKYKKTILIDVDSQGNLSSWLLNNEPKFELADYLYQNCDIKKSIINIYENLYLMPTFGLSNHLDKFIVSELPHALDTIRFLCEDIEKLNFDVAIFDLGPSKNLLTEKILVEMDEIVTPVAPEFFSLDGIEIFQNDLQSISKRYRKEIEHSKVIVNLINNSLSMHKKYVSSFETLNFSIYKISQDTKIKESQDNHLPIQLFEKNNKNENEFIRIAKDIIRR